MSFREGAKVVFTIAGARHYEMDGVRAPIFSVFSKQTYEIVNVNEDETYDVALAGYSTRIIRNVPENFLMKNKTRSLLCAHCGGWVEEHLILPVHTEDSIVGYCPACVSVMDEIERCNYCGEYYADGEIDVHIFNGQRYCQSCAPQCYDCGAPATHIEQGTGRTYCRHCYENRMNTDNIKTYNFKPQFIKRGESDENRFFGLEIEIDGGGESDTNWRTLRQEFPHEFVYAMHDGSLDNGFEIATQPATLDYLAQIDWESFRKACVELGYTSHNSSTCGLHVHVDAQAFGDTMEEQELRVGRILYFFSKFKPHIVRFSRRSKYSMERWANIESMSTSSEQALADKAKQLKYEDKYRAINLNHIQSVEFRIFRGTLNPKTIKATLEFVNALIDISRGATLQEIQTNDWGWFVDKFFQNPELLEYLTLKKIDTNEIPETIVVNDPQ